MEDTIKALSDRLKELETQLAQQPAPGNIQTIKVKVPKERRLRKYEGVRDDRQLEDWIADATRAVQGQDPPDAVDFLVYHLEGAAKDEVRLRPPEEWATPGELFHILRTSFREQLTGTQALRKFFERRQRDRESVRDFAHSLMALLSRVQRLDPAAVADKDKVLRDQFVENLRDGTLRREVRRWTRDNPSKTFQDVREEVQQWTDDDEPPARRVRAQEASLAGPQEFACSESKSSVGNEKLIADLVAGQRVLADGLSKQQEILTRHIHEQGQALAKQQEVLTQLMAKMESKPGKPGRCYGCGQPGHYRWNCPERQQGTDPGADQKPAPRNQSRGKSASNSGAPRQ